MSEAEDKRLKSILYALGAVLLWSTVATAFKLTLRGMDYAQLLFYSSVASTAVLYPFARGSGIKPFREILGGKEIKKFLLLGLVNPFLYYLVLFKAYSLLPAQEAQPLNYTWPIAISVFSVIFLGQKLTGKTIAGLVLAFAGVIIIATRGNPASLEFHSLSGVLLAAGSSLIWATFWTLNLVYKMNDSLKLFGAFFFGTVYTAVYILFTGSFIPAGPEYFIGAVYIGLFEMGITFFLWMKGLQLSKDKAKTSTLAYLSPFISLVFIALVLGEKLFPSSIAGLVLIVGGILIQQNFRRTKKQAGHLDTSASSARRSSQ